jgi:LytS/YehU family sensor histidine kinase
MLLLPLLDEALHNGLEPLSPGGSIDVRARRAGNRLRVTVADDGLGLLARPAEGQRISSVRERLAALYGDSATLTVSSGVPRGVVATIELPSETACDHR